MSTVVGIRVPRKLKEEMEKAENVNWSEYLRASIEDRLKREKLRRIARRLDELRQRTPESPDPDYSTKSIRQDRQVR